MCSNMYAEANKSCFVIGNNQYISASEADNFSIKSNSVWHSSLSQSSSDSNNRPTPPLTPASISNELNSSSNTGPTTTTRRNMGGRKPSKPTNISPEEEERRILRRERNKMAAARCRKRRVDHTNQLLEVSIVQRPNITVTYLFLI